MDKLLANIKKEFPKEIPSTQLNNLLTKLYNEGYIEKPLNLYDTMSTEEFLYLVDLHKKNNNLQEFNDTFTNLKRETESILYDNNDLLVTDENDLDLKAKDILLRCVKAYLKYEEPKKGKLFIF
ncbi:hypothetical protein TUBRATIS_009720 [Tubulinosema ratisbonensis]|uniref:Uncharacterized protein n=1 Tax=Tubulinosema ratisbonensis TaxID=291195 RepID=A0A437AMX7_9MICR|nr:hypothetical protein TUBRATIS_009720 [Tubulinosema ratisbonensis]